MRRSARRSFVIAGLVALAWAWSSTDAAAQYRPPAKAPAGEDYHIEGSLAWWNADPSLLISSEALGIPGDNVDLIKDLSIVSHKLRKLDLVLRPAKKHRFRFEYLPISYSADTVILRSFVFNGQVYNIGLPVQTTAQFNTSRFGYEYDFLYTKHGFLGALFDLKYTDVNVEISSPLRAQPEFTTAVAPIPTIGIVGRGYLAPQVAVNGEVSIFRVPDSLAKDRFDGSYTDVDFNVTYNYNRFVGAVAGYRRLSVFYQFEKDSGSLKFSGLYFGGVIRY
ncbi:MAG: hypothetical protein ABI665_04200 [Vicinamibacterales bacterium]